jgi:DNA-binding MarR family transcriptional regulator
MDPALDGAELDQLLGLLLRMLSPAAVAPGAHPAGNDHAGTPPPGGPAGGGPAEGGRARGGPAPGRTGPAGKTAGGPPVVSASEARALTELLAAHGIAQGQLGALLGLEKSTVSRLAAGLESKGWIRRGRDEQNHRYVRLYLTPQGRAVADRLWRAWQSRQERILAGLTAEERAGLALGLRGVLRALAAEGLLTAAPQAG